MRKPSIFPLQVLPSDLNARKSFVQSGAILQTMVHSMF